MNEHDYIELLSKYLRVLPSNEKDEIIRDYIEHFAVGRSRGLNDNDIVNQLGDPWEIAKEYVATSFYNKSFDSEKQKEVKENKKEESKYFTLLSKILSLGFIWIILIFPLGIAIVATIFSLALSGGALCVTGVVFGGVYAVTGGTGIVVSSLPFFSTILIMIGVVSIGVFLFYVFAPMLVNSIKLFVAVTRFMFIGRSKK